MSPVRPTVFEANGFAGFRDVPGPGDFVYWMENFRFEEPGSPKSALVARGPWVRLAVTAIGTPSYGAGPYHTGGIHEFIKNDGTAKVVLISGGKFYTYDASTITESLTAANLSAASVTLGSQGIVYMATFNNQVVVSDGVNTPWMWDGTLNGGITKLTNAPVAYGPPAVYYAKLFFIKNTDRATIVWSEENQANTGYEAGGYNNAWTLLQSGSEGLVALQGTNEALHYWRYTGHGAVRGAVTSTFTTTGTHDEGSEEVGLLSGSAMTLAAGSIWFADQVGRPWRRAGSRLEPLWSGQLDRTFGEQIGIAPYAVGEFTPSVTPGVPSIEVVYQPGHNAVAFIYKTATSSASTALLFDAESGRLIEVAKWGASASVGTARVGSYQKLRNSARETGLIAITHGSRAAVLYDMGSGIQVGLLDQLDTSGTTAYTPLVIGPQYGHAPGVTFHVDEALVISESGAVGGQITSGSMTCTFDYLTSVAYTSTLMATAATDTVSSGESGNMTDRQHRFGLDGYGRWVAPRVQLGVSFTSGTIGRLALKSWALFCYPERDPRAR